ncbi:MAG: DMT family transporter [Bacteroidia bacterium]
MSRALLHIHLAVLLFGVAGLFGQWLALPPVWIVLGRTLFAAGALGLVAAWRRESLWAQGRDRWWLLALGPLLAFHWVAFFAAIQQAGVAVALLTFSAFPLFTTLLEALALREQLHRRSLWLSLVILAGVLLIVPPFAVDETTLRGGLWGLASGASFALLALLNRRQVARHSSRKVAFYQNLSGALVLLPLAGQWAVVPTLRDGALLLLLGVVFTGLSHTLFIGGMKEVRARTAALIAALEPVYGIFAAWLLLGEVPGLRTLAGGALILGASLAASLGAEG